MTGLRKVMVTGVETVCTSNDKGEVDSVKHVNRSLYQCDKCKRIYELMDSDKSICPSCFDGGE